MCHCNDTYMTNEIKLSFVVFVVNCDPPFIIFHFLSFEQKLNHQSCFLLDQNLALVVAFPFLATIFLPRLHRVAFVNVPLVQTIKEASAQILHRM